MISERMQPTFTDPAGQKYYYFLKPCVVKAGKMTTHLFIFDENGLLDECRYFLSETYMTRLGRELRRRTPDTPPYHRYYDLVPNGPERYPKSQYVPLLKAVPLGTEDDDNLTVDRRYHLEMMLQRRTKGKKETHDENHV